MASFDEKTLKKVIKEGGKRGVEIEGAATMGGLEFFCSKLDEPQGNSELLLKSLEAMNAPVDENEEERRGGSGAIGKMLFSCNDDVLAIVSYVPEDKQDKISATEWLQHILDLYKGTLVKGDKGVAAGEIKANQSAGVFTLKIRDELLTKSIEFLRGRKLFPEAADDSSDDEAMGDDFFDDL